MSTPGEPHRVAQLAAGLAAVQQRVATACAAAGRSSHEVTLIVVTKFFPVEDVRALIALGVQDIGESRDQEAGSKLSALSAAEREAVTVHFIGQLQSNKARHVRTYADVIQSVDRVKVVRALGNASEGSVRNPTAVLAQVDLAGDDAGRGGVPPRDLAALVDSIDQQPTLQLRGLMAVAPIDADPQAAFRVLHELSCQVQQRHPQANWISAGMSGDLEQAVAAGATHLRVGSAILGSRPPQR